MTRLCHGWDHAWYCDAVPVEIARFAKVATGASPGTPVPTCPGWSLADLVAHSGRVHRWAATMVRRRSPRRLELTRAQIGLPADEAGYPAWLAEGAGPLTDALRNVDPDTPMWAWGADQHARFWSRRMLHETTVHRADAELALGMEPAIDPAVAVDGIDEFLDNLPGAAYFSPSVTKLCGDGKTLRFAATDTGVSWWIELGVDGFTWRHGDGTDRAAATALLRGQAADLVLLLYGRRDRDDDRVEPGGDDAVLDHWLQNATI